MKKELEKISTEELRNIDLDIYNLMKQMPNNELYNALYVRWEKHTNDCHVRMLCNRDDLTGLLGFMVYEDENTTDDMKEQVVEPTKAAVLNLAIHVLKDRPEEDVNNFIELLRMVRAGEM